MKMKLSLLVLICLLPEMIATKIELRSSVYMDPPFMMWEGTENNVTDIKGFVAEMLKIFTKNSDIELSYVPINQSQADAIGISGAVLRQLVNKEIDLGTYLFAQSPDRNIVMDFLHGLLNEYKLMVNHPEADDDEISVLTVAKPFQYEVWIAILVSFLVTRLVIKLKNDITPIVLANNRTRCIQGKQFANRLGHLNLRLFMASSGLMMTILTNSYTTTLISDSTVIKLKPIPNSFEDLVRDSSRRLIIEHTVLKKSILKAESGSMKIIGDQLRRNPDMTISSRKEIVPNVLKGKVYAGPAGIINNLIQMGLKKNNGKCMFASSQSLFSRAHAFGLIKNSPWREKLTKRSMYLMEYGLLENFGPVYSFNQNDCKVQPTKFKKEETAISFNNLSGGFVILGLGISFSLLVFLSEIFLHMSRKRKIRHSMKQTGEP